MYNKGKQFENYFWAILGALRGSSMIRLGLSCFPAILSLISICTCEIRKQYDKKFLSINPKYGRKKKIIFGGPGGPLCRTQVNENFMAVIPHNRADKFKTREKNNYQFFIYGPQCEKKCAFWAIRGGGGLGGPQIIRLGPSCFPAILSPIALSIYI